MRPYEEDINKLPEWLQLEYALDLLEYHLEVTDHDQMVLNLIGVDSNFGMKSAAKKSILRTQRLFLSLWKISPENVTTDVLWSNVFYDSLKGQFGEIEKMIRCINAYLKEHALDEFEIKKVRRGSTSMYYMQPTVQYPRKTYVQDFENGLE